MMTKAEHLKWAKDRALVYCDTGNPQEALVSFMSDLGKHPETAGHPAIMLRTMLMIGGRLSTPEDARKFIEESH